MARPRRDEVLRYENTFLTDEDRKSGFIPAAPTARREGKGKRSLEDMMASMATDATQASYAMERIASYEDNIAKVLKLCTEGALEIVLRDRPTLRRYVPDDGDDDDG